ncbi:MAG TPA: hypothetical protein VIM58_12365, partial [Candidatus Methylacidiphilales bacterium]
CPGFGRFVVVFAVILVLQYAENWAWSWVLLSRSRNLPLDDPDTLEALGQSRSVVASLLKIAFGLAVVLVQYLGRRPRLAVALGVAGLLSAEAAVHVWPWDFVRLLAPAQPVPEAVDVSKLRVEFDGNHSLQEQASRPGEPPKKTLFAQLHLRGVPADAVIRLRSVGGEVAYPDGKKRQLAAPAFNIGDSQPSATAIDAPLGDLVLLSSPYYGNFQPTSYASLYAVDADDFAKHAAEMAATGDAVVHLKGHLSRYRIATEIPLRRGASQSQGSLRTTLVDILKTPEGVDLNLSRRTMQLLLQPGERIGGGQPVYVLVNRKRSEALAAQNGNFYYGGGFQMPNPLVNFLSGILPGGASFENATPIHLTFGPSQNFTPARALPVPLDDAWLADAVLVELRPSEAAPFDYDLRLPGFAVDGHTLPDWNAYQSSRSTDFELLNAIVLPDHPTKIDAWRYVLALLGATSHRNVIGGNDPEIGRFAKVGPEHGTELIVALNQFQTFYLEQALSSLDLSGNAEAKAMAIRLLPTNEQMLPIVVANHWEKDARAAIFERLSAVGPGQQINDNWIRALGAFREEPGVKDLVLRLLPANPSAIEIVTDAHWEEEAKPIVVAAIGAARPGDRIDSRWIVFLNSFHDDSAVKAGVLRSLRTNQATLDLVYQNHWEADAKPILLDAVKNARQNDTFDDSTIRFLASYKDDPEVKAALLRILPWNQNVIDAVLRNHWEADAKPILLDLLAKAQSSERFNPSWTKILALYKDEPEVKAALFRILPANPNVIDAVVQNHWEADAKPILLERIARARREQGIHGKWLQVVATFRDPSTYDILLDYAERR